MKKYPGIELGDLFFIEPTQLITAYDKDFARTQAFEAFDQENWLEAERLYRGIVLQSEGEDKESLDSAIHMLAFTLAMKEEFQEALLLYEQLLHQAQEIKNISNEAIVLHQIGMVFRMDKKYQEALKFFNMEKALRENGLQNDFVGFSANAYELGQIALDEKRLEEAFIYFTQSLEHGEKAKDLICMGCAHRGLGHYFREIGNLSNSQYSFEKSIFIFEQAGDLQGAQKVRDHLNDLKKS